MPCELMNLVIAFAPLFSKPVFNRVKVLLTGAILSPASRTVANALRVMGLSQEKHFQNYHRVLGRATWNCLEVSRRLLNLLVKTFDLSGEIVIGFDDTVERRRGKQIKAKGIYRDAVRSSKSFFVKTSGLRWLSFMLLTEVPFARRVWALPFLTVLCPSDRSDRERGIRHRRLTDRARQAILLIKRWLPQLDLVFVGDSSFAALDAPKCGQRKSNGCFKVEIGCRLVSGGASQKKRTVGAQPQKRQAVADFASGD